VAVQDPQMVRDQKKFGNHWLRWSDCNAAYRWEWNKCVDFSSKWIIFYGSQLTHGVGTTVQLWHNREKTTALL